MYEAWTDDLVGMMEAQARVAAHEEGCVVRVARRDGIHYPVTPDYRTDRVKLEQLRARLTQEMIIAQVEEGLAGEFLVKLLDQDGNLRQVHIGKADPRYIDLLGALDSLWSAAAPI